METGVREYWIINPSEQSVYVYYLVKNQFKPMAYTFVDKIKVNIYGDFEIDFAGLNLSSSDK